MVEYVRVQGCHSLSRVLGYTANW